MINTRNRLSDQLEREKVEIENFYSHFLGLKLDLYPNFLEVQESKTKSLGRFEFIPESINEDFFIGLYEELYGQGSVLFDYYCKGTVSSSIGFQQKRPKSYLMSHLGNPLPDVLNKNISEVKDGFVLMTPKEGIISALRLRTSEDCRLDVHGSTYFFAVDKLGNLLRMSGYNGYFSVRSCDSCNRNKNSGFRKVSIF